MVGVVGRQEVRERMKGEKLERKEEGDKKERKRERAGNHTGQAAQCWEHSAVF